MSTEPAWVMVDQIIGLNKRVVSVTDEPHGLIHGTKLEAAVARPRQHFHYGPDETHDDIVLLGVKLCVGVSEAQAFGQGNKRTGFGAMELFFNLNGYRVDPGAHGRIADLILAAAHPDRGRRLSEDDVAWEMDELVVELHGGTILSGAYGMSVAPSAFDEITIAFGKVTPGNANDLDLPGGEREP